MKPELRHNLLYTTMSVCYKESIIEVENILIDTGSASTVFSIDILSAIGVRPEPTDIIRTIRGIGGTETVFSKTVDFVQINDFKIDDFEIEVAGMDYGFSINGILGMDFLIPSGAILDLKAMEINFT